MFTRVFEGLIFSYSFDNETGCYLLYNNEQTKHCNLMGRAAKEFELRLSEIELEPLAKVAILAEILIGHYL